MPSASRIFWLGATWLPVGMLWYAYVLRVRNDSSFAAVAALVMMAALGVLAGLVWTLSGRYPWGSETRDHVVFVLRYPAIGIVLVVAIMNVDAALVAWHDGITLSDSLHRSGGLLAGDMWSYLAFYLVSVVYLLAVSVAYQVRAYQRLAVQRLALAEAEARVAREKLHALRAQLNPHFLFNVLHSVSCLVRDDARAAEKAIEHLGEMLRYVLDDAAGDDVELEDEWAFVRHYLALEALRLADRLHVETELDPEALEWTRSRPPPHHDQGQPRQGGGQGGREDRQEQQPVALGAAAAGRYRAAGRSRAAAVMSRPVARTVRAPTTLYQRKATLVHTETSVTVTIPAMSP
jgi:Histidine kinase